MNDTKPLVSVCCITYNHANYIRDAIEGFLMQKTTFPIEILIHDDASTDGTAEIVKGYAEKHPDLIFPIFQKENQYSKGKKPNIEFNFPRARGKYIALCEGDDFWTDPSKLQKQVEFLEANSDCSWCFHAAKHIFVDKMGNDYIDRPKVIPKSKKFTAKDIILGNGDFFTTASTVFCAHVTKELPEWFSQAPVGDFPLALIATSKGYAGYINNVMCVYRKNVQGSWSTRKRNWQELLHFFEKTEQYLWEFNHYSHGKFEKILKFIILRNRYALLSSIRFYPHLLRNLGVWIKSFLSSDIFEHVDFLNFFYVFSLLILRKGKMFIYPTPKQAPLLRRTF